MDGTLCTRYCSLLSFQFSAISNVYTCKCGNSLPDKVIIIINNIQSNKVKEGFCNLDCKNLTQNCGGWYI